MVEMVVLKACTFVSTEVFSSSLLWHVNQTKTFVTTKGYHVVTITINILMIRIARLEQTKQIFPPQYSSFHHMVNVNKETRKNIIYDSAACALCNKLC